MFSSKRVRKRARHDTQGSSIPPILEPSVKREQPSGKSHSSIQQPSVNTRNVTQRIDSGAVYPGATQGLFHPQALNPSAIPLGQDDGVDMNSPFTLPAAATNPQLTVSPRVIQYPSGMTRQQVMGNTIRAIAPVVEATHTGAVDTTSSHSVSVQSSSISDRNTVSLQSHPTIPVVFPVQSVKGYDDKFSNVSQLPLSLPLITPPSLLSPPPAIDYGVTSTVTAPTSNPNTEISDSYQSSTTSMQAVSVSSSLPSSNTFPIATTSNMISSGLTTNESADSGFSPSLIPLDQSSITESDQMGMMGMVAGGSAGGAGGTGLTNRKFDPEKCKLIQQQFVLLLHADKCQRREREHRPCTLTHCSTMKNVLNHMTECQDGKACQVPYCASSRQILDHWKNCNHPDCPVCQPLKSAAPTAVKGLNIFGGTMAGPNQGMDILPMSSPQVGPGVHQESLNNVGVNMVGAPRGGSMENYPGSLSNNETLGVQHNPTMNNPSSMMGLMGGGGRPDMVQQMQPMQGIQSWHQDVSPDLRQHLVRKLVTTIFPVQDQNELQDPRVMSLIQYAKKVEKGIFEKAHSREQYYELMADKIYKIQKEMEERRSWKRQQPNIGMMANYNVGTDYDVGSDPALIPMHRMASRAHPINPSTSYSQGNLDVSGYSWNQPQRTSSMVPSSTNTQLDTCLSDISLSGRPLFDVPPPPSVPGIPLSPTNSTKASMDFNQTQKLSGDLFGYKEHSLESELEKLFNESFHFEDCMNAGRIDGLDH